MVEVVEVFSFKFIVVFKKKKNIFNLTFLERFGVCL